MGTVAHAQNTIFFENFEGEQLGAIGVPGTNWTVTERDGNNYSWHTWNVGPSQNNVATSFVDGNTDNVLTSRNIQLPTSNTVLSFRASTDDSGSTVRYAVYILGNNATFQGTEAPLFQEILNTAGNTVQLPTFVTRSINIPSNYMGQAIRLCFRNFQSSGGNQLRIDDIKVATGSVLGVSESSKSDQTVKVYPNPVKNQLTIESPEKIISAEVFDMTGRFVKTVLNENKKIDMSSLESGEYLIKIETKKGINIQKVIKK